MKRFLSFALAFFVLVSTFYFGRWTKPERLSADMKKTDATSKPLANTEDCKRIIAGLDECSIKAYEYEYRSAQMLMVLDRRASSLARGLHRDPVEGSRLGALIDEAQKLSHCANELRVVEHAIRARTWAAFRARYLPHELQTPNEVEAKTFNVAEVLDQIERMRIRIQVQDAKMSSFLKELQATGVQVGAELKPLPNHFDPRDRGDSAEDIIRFPNDPPKEPKAPVPAVLPETQERTDFDALHPSRVQGVLLSVYNRV